MKNKIREFFKGYKEFLAEMKEALTEPGSLKIFSYTILSYAILWVVIFCVLLSLTFVWHWIFS